MVDVWAVNRLAVISVLALALLAAASVAGAAEPEEADESALVEAFEECEEDPICEEEVEAEEAEAEASYPEECVLRSAKAHAVLRKSRLKLTIGYTTSEPTKATIILHYGATKLSSFKRHLRRSGVLRVTKQLKGTQGSTRLPVRVQLSTEGTGCPSRRLVLFPK
jgi:hypothetical protein